MNKEIEARVLVEAEYICKTHNTVRKTAEVYGLSKSTVHNDVSYKLKKLDPVLYLQIKDILKINFEEKHLRGGEATKRKYKSLKKV